MHTAVREALGAFATPDVAEEIVVQALRISAKGSIPPGGAALASFVSGPLYAAAADKLGHDMADHAAQMLDMIVRMTPDPDEVSQVRDRPSMPITPPPSTGPSVKPVPIANEPLPLLELDLEDEFLVPLPSIDPEPLPLPAEDSHVSGKLVATLPPPQIVGSERPSAPPGRGVVLIAAASAARVHALATGLRAQAAVHHVTDALTLLELAHEHAPRPIVIILDGAAPSVHPSTLATMAPDLPANATFIAWGIEADRMTENALETAPFTYRSAPLSLGPEGVARLARETFQK